MARKHRKVFMHTWNDERFRQLDPPGKLLALYILTGQSNRIGCFYFSPALASEHTGIPLEPSPNVPGTFRDGSGEVSGGLNDLLERVCRTLFWKWDASARILFIPSWWRHNPPENVNVFKGALADAEELPQSPLVQEFWQNGKYLPPGMADVLAKRSGNVTETTPKPSPIQEQEQEQEQEEEDSSEPDKPASDPASKSTSDGKRNTAPAETPLLVFPVVGNAKTKTWPLSRAKAAELQEAFPSLDVPGECRRALQWARDNPDRTKTARGMGKFLFNWMSRAQNSGSGVARTQPPTVPRSSADQAEATLNSLI